MAKKLTKGQSIGWLLFGIGCIWFIAAHSDDTPPAPAKHEKAGEAAPVPYEPSTAEASTDTDPKTIQKLTLTEAIDTARPGMMDTVDDTSAGTAALALWASVAPMKWDELMKLTRAKAPLVFKDPDEQRGKLLCASGDILEITAERVAAEKVYLGGLVDLSIGRIDYSNSGGGTTHAIQLVGMFKLPANVKVAKA